MNTKSHVDKIENCRYNKHMNRRSSIEAVLEQMLKQVVKVTYYNS